MKRKRSKSGYVIFGYILVIVGLLLPLTGFMSMSVRNFNENRNFKAYVEENQATDEAEREGIEAYNDRFEENYMIDPFDNEKYQAEYDFYREHPDKVFAYLTIPKLDINKPIYLDASQDHLARGVAHVYGTSLPVDGVNRRSVIAGHRGWYGDTMFLNLHKLESGDEMIVTKDGEALKYIVSDTEVIDPSDWEALQPRAGQDMLTMLTCEPLRPPRTQRLLINAVREEVPEETVQETPQEVDETEKAAPVDPSVKRLNLVIYLVTLVLLGALIAAIVKFVRYLRK